MRISDWSSDVCSSDLHVGDAAGGQTHGRHRVEGAEEAPHEEQVATDDEQQGGGEEVVEAAEEARRHTALRVEHLGHGEAAEEVEDPAGGLQGGDRKSTRLNSSH